MRSDIIKAALRRLSPAERERLARMAPVLAEPVEPPLRVIPWDNGKGQSVAWGEMEKRPMPTADRRWVL